MPIERLVATGRVTPAGTLSGRARATLLQHQRRVAVLERDLQGADRILAGALTACDGPSQFEMLSSYLEAVQELRVTLQRLEAFLLQRLVDPDEAETEPAAHPLNGNGATTALHGD